jgi:hypothetical protein
MRIICLFLLIALAISSSDYDQGNNHLYHIYFNTRYTVDVTRYVEGYLPGGHSYFFGLAVERNDQMYVECRVIPTSVIDFKVDVCVYNTQPTDIQIVTGALGTCAANLKADVSRSGNYDIYKYPFQTGEYVTHASIHLQNYQSLHYLDVYIYSEKGMGAAIIVLIILAPLLIIAAIVAFICRRCGCITIGVSSSSVSGGVNYI